MTVQVCSESTEVLNKSANFCNAFCFLILSLNSAVCTFHNSGYNSKFSIKRHVEQVVIETLHIMKYQLFYAMI
nr:unnamed protein product [Callosobruchus chinensis]